MKIDRRITNGLAWAGVLLVVGVPTADLLSAQLIGTPGSAEPEQIAVIEPVVAPMPAPLSQRPAAPVVKPVEVAAVTPKPTVAPAAPVAKPAVAAANQTSDAVDNFLQSGRQLPGYITGATAPAAAPQVAATQPARTPIITTPVAVDPVEVAAIGPQKVAPVPMPLSMRPQPVAVAAAAPVVVIPPGLTPATPNAMMRPPAAVSATDLEDWETGPLSDFLAMRQGGNAYVAPRPDGDGFFLDEAQAPRQRDRIIAREVDEPFFIFD